jgi:diguanylate cyclase (GGDEF)-like protein/PAS domain S-box-containing protein
MSDRAELLEAALDSLPEGVVLVSAEGGVCFWNRAAEAITGYGGAELMGRPAGEALRELVQEPAQSPAGGGAALVRLRHKLGHEVMALAHVLAMRDGMGEKIGTQILFHPAESLDALPHGETEEEEDDAGREDLDERLASEFEDAIREGLPFGVLWIAVDRARELRQSHGRVACQAMLNKVERALRQGLRPGEQLGRWGDEEFLVVAHERNAGMLAVHARTLAGLARTADFRWWGDRISITVSIGSAQADAARDETLAQLLERAREAMVTSIQAGGNRVTPLPGSETCLPL